MTSDVRSTVYEKSGTRDGRYARRGQKCDGREKERDQHERGRIVGGHSVEEAGEELRQTPCRGEARTSDRYARCIDARVSRPGAICPS